MKYLISLSTIYFAKYAQQLQLTTFLLIVVHTTLSVGQLLADDCGCADFQDKFTKFGIALQSGNATAMKQIYNELLTQPSDVCKAYAVDLQAHIALYNGSIDSAKVYAQKERTLLDKITCNSKSYNYNEFLLGYLASIEGDWEQSAIHTLNCAEIKLKEGDTTNYLVGLYNVSQILMVMDDYKRAIEILDKAYAMERVQSKKKNSNDVYGMLHLIKCMTNAYQIAYEQTNNSKYLDKWKEWSKMYKVEIANHNVPHNRIDYYRNQAGLYKVLNEYNKAIEYADSALHVVVETPARDISSIFTTMSECYTQIGNHPKALRYADSALHYAQITKAPDVVSAALSRKYRSYKASGKYEEALYALEESIRLSDSVESNEQLTKVRALELKYNKVKNEQTIRDLAQQQEITSLNNRLLLALLVGVVLFVVVLLVLYRQKTLRDKQLLLEIEQRLQRARINPHFFFNALASLQSFALSEHDIMRVSGYLGRYAKVMRQTLESSYNELVSIADEVEYLKNYLEIEMLREPNKFRYEIHCDEDIEPDDMLLPSMIIQPFIENSIEHGFRTIDYEGVIEIHFEYSVDTLRVTITDNGTSGSAKENREYPSRAMQITRDRLYLLNKQHNTHAVFTLTENKDRGKRVDIILPHLYQSLTPSLS
jgi:tetratricopeptide (TPR) repeat protein